MSLKLKKIFLVFIIFSFLSSCPGISDGLRLWAQEASVQSNNTEVVNDGDDVAAIATGSDSLASLAGADDPFAVSTDASQNEAVVQAACETVQKTVVEDSVKKEMSRAEQLAWTIGKALLPTLAVMAFGAAVVCPLAWVVVGSVIIGAATAGITTFAYESRLNQFRDEGKKKSKDKILRDVSIAAAVEGAMAPFTMLTAGFVKAIGPVTVKSIVTAAAKAGATQFIGGTISNLAKGGVTNLWYDHYYNYDEEEKALKKELDSLNARGYLSEEEKLRVAEIMQRLDTLNKEKYSIESFIKDEEKTAVSAAITGVLGGAATQVAGNQNWAKIASDKLFKSPKNAGLIAKAVVSNPFAFLSGSANAAIQKHEIDLEIARCRRLQAKYDKDSAIYAYYEDKIKGLQEAKEKIDLLQSGIDAMINNLAVQSAGLTVAVARARLWDLPHARRDAIAKKMKEVSPEWQKAEKIKASADALRANAPKRENFVSRSDYFKALAEHRKAVAKLDADYKAAKVIAVNSEKTLEGKALREQVTREVDEQIQLQRKIDLAKSMGDEEYLKFKMEEIRKKAKANDQVIDDDEVRKQAVEEFKEEYRKAAQKNAETLAKMEEKLTLRKDGKELKGKIITDESGKRFVVLEDADGVERFRRAIDEPKVTWYNKFFQKDPAQRDLKELETAYRLANAGGAMVSPSQYRAAYVDMKVNELKAQGMTSEQVNLQIDDIVREANSAMINTFGGTWRSAAQAEMLAAGLTKAKYNNGEPPDLQKIWATFQSTAQSKLIAEFQKELSNQAKEYTLTPIKKQLIGEKPDSKADKFISTALDTAFKEGIQKTTDAQIKDIYQQVEKKAASVIKEAATEATYDYNRSAASGQ
ncbi:MAG: hypothetical protein Kow0029_10230 [Candidatus Rifleibacteriota bacterium]